MILYEVPHDCLLEGYLKCTCWDGGNGLERLRNHGIDYRVTTEKKGIQLAKNGHTTSISPKSILVGWEPPLISPITYLQLRKSKWLGKIFTSIQPDGLHCTITNPLICDGIVDVDKKDKFCCMVAANKNRSGENNLYPLRHVIIEEGLKYDGFDLYGTGWDGIKCYRGQIPWDYTGKSDFGAPKTKKMSEYRFAFVTENSTLDGYVTEKIINALVARCIPIYEGAPDIEKYVPKECFIDLKKLGIEKSFEYIINMTDEVYDEYIMNIEEFITTDKCYYLSSYYMADQILSVLEKA